ncbi:hypothetical protein Patl1_28486 [Pistacia atlantica]|uniref:Uncharacterized protein n=1 Tax=Pistacia atlantica TaxID=434234 RepID=A0ACC1BCB6_9ROSI|nr:hypothetical protein Patl1_28486 [Pistacia atlantica]
MVPLFNPQATFAGSTHCSNLNGKRLFGLERKLVTAIQPTKGNPHHGGPSRDFR